MTATPKPPVDPVRWKAPPVDPLPDFPPADLTVVPVPGNAPEDVVVDADGNIWTGVDDGGIVRISPDGEPTVVANTGGRPLGLAVANDGRLLVCDSPRGLLAMDTGSGKFETLVDEVDGRSLRFCSNVIEIPDGTIFFTESTSAFTYAHYLGAIFEARARGSLFRRDPDGTVLTVVPGMYFANGVTPTADGSALVIAETQGRRLSKYWLTGPQAGTVTPFAVNLPGMPDNLSTGADGRIWVPSSRQPTRWRTGWPRGRRFSARCCGGCRSGCIPHPSRSCGPSPSTPTAARPTAGVRMTHPSFGLVTGVVESTARCGWAASERRPSRTVRSRRDQT